MTFSSPNKRWFGLFVRTWDDLPGLKSRIQVEVSGTSSWSAFEGGRVKRWILSDLMLSYDLLLTPFKSVFSPSSSSNPSRSFIFSFFLLSRKDAASIESRMCVWRRDRPQTREPECGFQPEGDEDVVFFFFLVLLWSSSCEYFTFLLMFNDQITEVTWWCSSD